VPPRPTTISSRSVACPSSCPFFRVSAADDCPFRASLRVPPRAAVTRDCHRGRPAPASSPGCVGTRRGHGEGPSARVATSIAPHLLLWSSPRRNGGSALLWPSLRRSLHAPRSGLVPMSLCLPCCSPCTCRVPVPVLRSKPTRTGRARPSNGDLLAVHLGPVHPKVQHPGLCRASMPSTSVSSALSTAVPPGVHRPRPILPCPSSASPSADFAAYVSPPPVDTTLGRGGRDLVTVA